MTLELTIVVGADLTAASCAFFIPIVLVSMTANVEIGTLSFNLSREKEKEEGKVGGFRQNFRM